MNRSKIIGLVISISAGIAGIAGYCIGKSDKPNNQTAIINSTIIQQPEPEPELELEPEPESDIKTKIITLCDKVISTIRRLSWW